MRLHNYLDDVLASKVKVKILRELFKFPSKSFTIRELAQSIKDITHTGIRKSLGDLQKSNIVNIEHHGQSNLISLNRNSEIYDVLTTLFENEAQKYSEFTQKLATGIPNGVKACALFGSIAKGTEKPDSDIDILFIADNQEKVMEYIDKKSKEITDKYGNVIIPYIMSENEFKKKRNTLFVKNILQCHKKLSGEDLWTLIQ